MKHKLLVILSASMLLSLGVAISGASAGGHNAGQLDKAGWNCIPAGPNNWTHCFTPKKNPNAEPKTMQVKVFSEDGSTFLGTELLIHENIYNGQPCPQDGNDTYDKVPGIPYFACHHFDTGHH